MVYYVYLNLNKLFVGIKKLQKQFIVFKKKNLF